MNIILIRRRIFSYKIESSLTLRNKRNLKLCVKAISWMSKLSAPESYVYYNLEYVMWHTHTSPTLHVTVILYIWREKQNKQTNFGVESWMKLVIFQIKSLASSIESGKLKYKPIQTNRPNHQKGISKIRIATRDSGGLNT